MNDYNLQQALWHDDLDRHVGHFTTFATATKFILPSREIRLSPLATTNDPRENKRKLFGATFADPDQNEFAQAGVQLLTNAVHHHVKAFCTTRNYLDENQAIHECFRRPRMWAQYGENHMGVCLIFDREALATEIEKAFPSGCRECIDYAAPSGRGDSFRHFEPTSIEQTKEAAVKEHLHKHAATLFFEKNADWKDECEYRYLVFDFQSSMPVQVNFQDALKAVILGVDFPKAYEPAVREVAGQVPVVNLHWCDSNHCLCPDTLDPPVFQRKAL